jgi:hypothetical protein
MKEKSNENMENRPPGNDKMLSALVKWYDTGVIHRGTVLRVFTKEGAKYLEIMSILGKRYIVRASRVKLLYQKNEFKF